MFLKKLLLDYLFLIYFWGGCGGRGGLYINVPKLVQSKQPQHNESWLFSMYFVVVGWGGWGGGGGCMSPSLARKSVSPYPGDATADTKSSTAHCYLRVQYFCCMSKQWCSSQCLGCVMCAQMLMHAFCTWGLYVWMPEDLHWKSTLGEKSLVAPGNRTHTSTVPGFVV